MMYIKIGQLLVTPHPAVPVVMYLFRLNLIFIRYTYQDNKKLYKYSQIMYRKGTTEKLIKMLPLRD